MKNYLTLLLVLILLVSCNKKNENVNKPVVAVSVIPQEFFVRELAGDLVEVAVLVPAGANPHIWEPRPNQMEILSRAKVFFAVGMELEAVWLPKIKSLNESMEIVQFASIVACGVGAHKSAADDHNHNDKHEHKHEHKHDEHEHKQAQHEHNHGHADPHIWTAPREVLRMAPVMTEKLKAILPEHHQFLDERLTVFLQRVQVLDSSFQALTQNLPDDKRNFLVYHPAFGHLAQHYGLTQLSVEVDGKEPRPAQLGSLVHEARARGIRTLLVQPQFPTKMAEALSRDLQVRIQVIDPLSLQWEENLRILLHTLQEKIP